MAARPPGQRVQRHPGAHRGRRGRAAGTHRPGAGLPPGPGGFAVDGRAVTLVRGRRPRPPGPGGDRLGLGGRGRRAGPGGPGRTAVGGGRPRRRAGRAGVGGRPPGRGGGGRAPRRHRPPGRGRRRFRPGPARRLGVLVDHLVPGARSPGSPPSVRHPDVLVTGTPFVDVWQAVRPSVLGHRGLAGASPMGTEWKAGICEALGSRRPPDGVAAHPGVGVDATPTSSRPWWARSSGSSTSSPSTD